MISNQSNSSESRETAQIHLKGVLAVAAWNVRTLMEVARHVTTVYTFSKYRLDAACLSEARFSHFGSQPITRSKQKRWLYYCAVSDNPRHSDCHISVEQNTTAWPMRTSKEGFATVRFSSSNSSYH